MLSAKRRAQTVMRKYEERGSEAAISLLLSGGNVKAKTLDALPCAIADELRPRVIEMAQRGQQRRRARKMKRRQDNADRLQYIIELANGGDFRKALKGLENAPPSVVNGVLQALPADHPFQSAYQRSVTLRAFRERDESHPLYFAAFSTAYAFWKDMGGVDEAADRAFEAGKRAALSGATVEEVERIAWSAGANCQ